MNNSIVWSGKYSWWLDYPSTFFTGYDESVGYATDTMTGLRYRCIPEPRHGGCYVEFETKPGSE